MQGVGAAEKVFEFIDRQPTMLNDGTLAPSQLEGKVEFRNVTFAYRTRPSSQVLQVNFSYLYIFCVIHIGCSSFSFWHFVNFSSRKR